MVITDFSVEQARELQRRLASEVIRVDCLNNVRFVAGIDIAINTAINYACAAVVVLTYPELTLVEQHTYQEPLTVAYIPGLLSFRELPSMLGAFAKVKHQPDLILVDGMGIAHPRRLGIASHLGIIIDIPTIGCGKSRLVGTYDQTKLGQTAGSWVPLYDKQEIIGAVVRTRTGVNPLFISLGHKISLQTSINYVLSCTTKYRLPEPVRQADKLSKNAKLNT
jgi:deoxyribonuclease V